MINLSMIIYSNLLQDSNIERIFITCEVLKLDKSNEDKEEQPLNIPPISVTFEVLKLDKSNEDKEEQE